MNIVTKIKNLLLNRNTVTILGVVAGVIVLWFAYTVTLDKAVKPIKVPVAKKELTAGTIITTADIDYTEVNSDALKKGSVITSSAKLIGFYVANNTSIVQGSMFYEDQVKTKDQIVTRDIEKIPEGYRLFWLNVDNTTTYANSIYPGDKIDLWLKTKHNGSYVYEEFISNIEVLSVKDSKGLNVFDVASGRTPAVLEFAVDDEMFTYLSKIKFLSGMELYPVPINKNNSDKEANTEITNDALKQLIDSQARSAATEEYEATSDEETTDNE